MRYIGFGLLPLTVTAVSCGLCGRKSAPGIGVDGLLHPVDFVNSKGKMCAQLMIELFKLDEQDPVCIRLRDLHYVRCCTEEGAPSILQDPPPPPPQFSLDGPFKRCDLCAGGSYPTATGMVINMLYVGPGSCTQYYEWGQKGWIQNHLCSALQHFARGPCGCSTSL